MSADMNSYIEVKEIMLNLPIFIIDDGSGSSDGYKYKRYVDDETECRIYVHKDDFNTIDTNRFMRYYYYSNLKRDDQHHEGILNINNIIYIKL